MDFNQADEKFRQLKTRFEAGELTEAEFKARLQDMMVQDEQGSWWMIGYETERWYRHDGSNWVQTDPPGRLSQKAAPVVPPQAEPLSQKETPPAARRPAERKGATASVSPSTGPRRSLIFIVLAALILVSLGGYYLLRGTGQASAPSPVPTKEITLTNTSTLTPKPTKTATLTPVPEYHVTIAVSQAHLYDGPGLGYELVTQKLFPRGEIFTVVSRDSSGFWFFSKSPEGLEGWLYVEWIDSDFDKSAISTIAFVPPPPPTRTRKPKSCPAPPGCNVWDPVACVCLG